MSRPYQILDLVEHTLAWWEWRRSGIGSADAPVILGATRRKSIERLLEEKRLPAPDSARRFEQQRSAKTEWHARLEYCRATGIEVAPTCIQSLARPWQRASLDGLSTDGQRAVEIKCGKSNYDSAAARRAPARHHVPQLQHILAVTGLPSIDYWCYCPPHPPLRLEIARDESYLARLLAAEEIFWQRLAPNTPTA